MARDVRFYERVCAALAARDPGGREAVARRGAPLGPGSLHRWMAAGLLTGREAAELRALGDDAGAELVQAALGEAEAAEAEWSWGALDEDRTVPEGQAGPKLAADEPLDESWSWSDGTFSSIVIPPPTRPFVEGPRFAVGEVLLEGRFFTVHAARDRLLGRELLIHRLRPEGGLGPAAFVAAVRRQARLQHPIIQPVYELGLDEGLPFYATAAVRDLRLDGLLKALAAGRSLEPLPRLLEVLLDVARGVVFAHRHGVIHRDLRPQHVRLGRFGEVQLGGWFRARRLAEPAAAGAQLNVVQRGLGYLAPERLGGGLAACDRPADVWGLGALLYGILARRPPYSGKSSTEVLARMWAGAPPPPDGRSEVPPALVALCAQTLVVDPQARALSAEAFASALEDYLEGTRAEARRLEGVDEQLGRAEEAARRHQAARARLRQAHVQASRARDPAAPAAAATARGRAEALRPDAERWFFEAEAEYEETLALLPGHAPARDGLAMVYHRALCDAALGLVRLPPAALEARLRALDGGGHAEQLQAPGSLAVEARDGGVFEVWLHAVVDEDGVHRPDAGARLGQTPLAAAPVAPGTWLVRLVAAGVERARGAVLLGPGEQASLRLDPSPPPEGFVHVPAGHFLVGARGEAAWRGHCLPWGRCWLPSFAISERLVTLGELQPFLNALAGHDPARAAACAPRSYLAEGPSWRPDPGGAYRLPFSGPDGRRWTAEHPAVGLTPAAVEAYLRWRQARDGRRYSLPSELQWAKAARGVAGWRYPWGERAEPAFCAALDGHAACPPVGRVAADRSLFGVADTAGTAREYTRGVHGDLVLRGGAWLLPFCECDLSIRAALLEATPLLAVGFRLALAEDDGFGELHPFPEPPEPPASDPYEPAGQTLIGLLTEDLTVQGHTVLGALGTSPPDQADVLGGWHLGPERYTLKEELARGSMGRVVLAWDDVLQRPVALKILHDRHAEEPLSRYRFVMEARITGRLQHPAILPIYDAGVLPGGQRFFAMKPVEGFSLGEILKGKAAGDRRMAAEFSRDRLVTVLRRICQAVAFAHAHKVVHRDLKPANILVGDLGEVLLVDLGLARLLELDPSDRLDVPETALLAKEDGRVTRVGSVIGTPYYMSPEQAMGLQEMVGPASDVYGLGALLYHALALRPPFTGRKINEVLRQVRRGNPQPPSRAAPDEEIPEALDLVVMQALAMDPDGRPPGALALADALARWQDQARLAAREALLWAERADRAAEAVRAFEDAQAALDLERARLAALRAELRGADGPTRRAAFFAAHRRLEALTVEVEAAVSAVVRRSRRALDPSRPEVLARLQRVLQTRYLHAERAGEPAALAWARRQLDAADPDGQVARWLRQGGPLRVRTQPPGRMARVIRWPPEGGAPETVHRGPTPVELPDVAPGAGLVRLSDGLAELQVPFLSRRGQGVDVEVAWPADPRRDFVSVPAGRFRYGGDPVADEGLPARGAKLPAFRIAVFPVTCGEWELYLRALEAVDPAQAAARRPRLRASGPALWSEAGAAIFGPFDPERPVTGISLADAHAYAQWRSLTERVSCRLPTSAEWEKAARGVDGRGWPWGDGPLPEEAIAPFGLHPVGEVPLDSSPYGMRDVATGVFEWTLTAARQDASVCYVRGSCSALPLQGDPCVRRLTWDPARPSPFIGFRLVIPT